MNTILRLNTQRSKWAIYLFGALLLIETLALVSAAFQYKLLNEAANGGFISTDEAEYNDRRELIIAILYIIIALVSLLAFILWFRRAYFNLHLKAEILSYTEGWAAGCWFVPFVNFVRPYKIMKELHLETNQLIEKKTAIESKNHIALINFWWTLWIANALIGNICFRMNRNPVTIEDFQHSTIASMIAHAVGIPLAIVTMVMIAKQSEIESQFAAIYDNEEPHNGITN